MSAWLRDRFSGSRTSATNGGTHTDVRIAAWLEQDL